MTHRYNDFISLLENFGMATESTATALNSAGSATKENEIYLDSIQGRYQTLSTTMEEFWINFINSDLVKGGISALQTLANALNGLQNTFGSLGMIVGASTFTFGMFSTSIKGLATDLVEKKTTLGGLSETIQRFKATLTDTSSGMNLMQRTTKATGDAFNTLGIASSLAQVKVMALQAVLSMGLSLAITAITSAIGKLIDSFTTAEERMDSINEKSQALASSLQSTEMASGDFDRYAEINEKLKQTNISEQERNELNQELISLKQSLSSLDAEASAILSNDNLSYQEQLDILKQINEEKMREKAEELDKQLGNGFWYQDESKNAEGAKGNIERSVEVLQQLEKLNGQSGMITTSDGGNLFVEASEIEGYIKEHTELIEKENIVLQRYNSNVELMKKVNYETDRSIISLNDTSQKFVDNMNKSTEAVDKNTQSKKENASVPASGSVDASGTGATQPTQSSASLGDYSKAVSELQEYYDMLNRVNEAGAITPEILSQLASNDAYAGLGASATDFASVQKYINDLIVEQEETASQAYASMLENDTNYYKNKLLLDENWIATFRQHLQDMGMSADEANNYDLGQFTTLQELKTGVLNQLGSSVAEWLNQYIDTSANGYNIDFANFKSMADAKVAVLNALKRETQLTFQKIENTARFSTLAKYSDNPLAQKELSNGIEDEVARLKELGTAIQEADIMLPDVAPNLNFGGVGSIGTGGVKFNNGGVGGSGSGSGSKGSGGKSATEREVEDLKDLVDQYYSVDNALDQVNNKLEENQALMENKEGLERLKYLEKEITLLNQQKKALENSKKARQGELNELKKQLQQRNFTFDGNGNISNYTSRVTYLQNWVNGQSGETKEKNKEAVEYTMELIEEYTKLLNEEIPSIANEINGVVNEIENVNNEMEELYQERLDVVANYESDVADMIQSTAEKKIEAEKEALEVALEADRKRIESKRKALEEEQELYNKEYEEENQEALLNEERNKLLDIQAEIDKLQYDTSREG